MLRALAVATALLCTSCVPGGLRSELPMRHPAAMPAEPRAVDSMMLEVRHLASGRWEVEYTLPRGTERLRFVRRVTTFRRSDWQVVTPGLRLVSTDSFEYIESSGGGRFNRAVVRFASAPVKHEREYILTPAFTDGSEALYTGLLYAAPQRGGRDVATTTALSFIPAPGERIILNGAVHEGTTDWNDRRGAGTYVYFGGMRPTRSARMVAIVDPGLPTHLRELFESNLPRLVDYFTERVGHALATRPVILIGYTPGDSRTMSSHGDVLPGVIRFGFEGAVWARDDDEVRRRAFYLIAHEAAHLWNGERFESTENRQSPWLHEGSAEAFAWLAMREFGVFTEQSLTEELEDVLNVCLFLTRGRPWARAMGSSTVPYACGGLMQMMAHAAMRDRGGLFALWRSVFDAAAAANDRYSPELWFDSLAARDARLAGVLQQLLGDSTVSAAPLITGELERLGVRARIDAPPARRSAAQRLGRRAMTVLMQADCGGRSSFNDADDGFRVNGFPECRTFPREGAKVVAFEDRALSSDAGGAYAAVAAQCATRGDVAITLEGRAAPIRVRCPEPLPPYVRVESWPASR